MKIGSKHLFTVPDKCPPDCRFISALHNFDQSAMCTHCPVFICRPVSAPEGDGCFCMVDPEDFRDDWAAEWERFFKDGTIPALPIEDRR
jgi:hypothetical protein